MTNPTLHVEIADIIAKGGNKGMTAKEIAAKVNKRKRYIKKDKTDVKSGQISARINQYSKIFVKRKGLIFLPIQPENPINKTQKI